MPRAGMPTEIHGQRTPSLLSLTPQWPALPKAHYSGHACTAGIVDFPCTRFHSTWFTFNCRVLSKSLQSHTFGVGRATGVNARPSPSNQSLHRSPAAPVTRLASVPRAPAAGAGELNR